MTYGERIKETERLENMLLDVMSADDLLDAILKAWGSVNEFYKYDILFEIAKDYDLV